MRLVHVGLSPWIIQDGNYDEFEVGGRYRFALEFTPRELVRLDRPSADAPPLVHLGGGMHRCAGTVVRVAETSWVVDFSGLPAYLAEAPPRWAEPGAFLSGPGYLGVDPFFYFENLKHEPGMPDLTRDWRVRRILFDEGWKFVLGEGGRVTTEHDASVEPSEVQRTDCWGPDGYGNYVLECELEPPG